MITFRAIGISIIFCLAAAGALAQQAKVDTPRSGQGYVFSNNDDCWLITPFHVLAPADFDEDPSTEDAKITVNEASVSISKRGDRFAADQSLDVSVFQLDHCPSFSPRSEPYPPYPDELVHRSTPTSLGHVAIEFIASSNTSIAVKAKPDSNNPCPLAQGMSGSMVLRDKKIYGMLVRVTNEECPAGIVQPLSVLNQFLSEKLDMVLPLHARAPELLNAAYYADSETFFALLDEIDDPNITDATGDTALERVATSYDNFYPFLEREGLYGDGHAVRANACQIWLSTRLEMAEELLKRGALVDGPRGDSRWTPLMNAIIAHDRCDNTPMVNMLLNHGAKPNRINVSRLPGSGDAKTTTPLMMAAEDGRPESVTALLDGGAEPELTSDSWAGDDLTPLFAIALNSKPNDNAGPLGHFYDDAYDSSCDRADSAIVAKFRLLLPVSKLDKELTARTDYKTKDYVGMTVQGVLEHRLGGGCTFSDCNGAGRVAEGRCLERMLGALLDFRNTPSKNSGASRL